MRKRVTLLFIVLMMLVPLSVWASEPHITGTLESTLYSTWDNDPYKLSSDNQLTLNISQSLGSSAVYISLKGLSALPVSGEDRLFAVQLDEAYADYYAQNFDIRFGKQRITWGTAMEMNPTDVVNPINPTNPLGDKQSILAGQFDYYLGNILKLTGVWIPFFEPALTSIRHPQTNELLEAEPVDNTLSQSELAFKLSAIGISGFDVSMSHFRGMEDIPYPTIGEHGMTALFGNANTYGLDMATAIGDFSFWAEGAYIVPENRDPYYHWILGSDYSFANGLLMAGQYYTRNDERGERSYIIIGTEKDFGTIHRARLGILYNLKNHSYMLSPEIKFSLADAAGVQIGARYFHTSDGSLGLPLLSEQSQIYAQLTVNF